jgi:hypothetical protein
LGIATICKVLPLFKAIEKHLQKAIDDLELEIDMYGLQSALEASLEKHRFYLDKALWSNYPLLGAGMSDIAILKSTLT